jgi:hypothetical protein
VSVPLEARRQALTLSYLYLVRLSLAFSLYRSMFVNVILIVSRCRRHAGVSPSHSAHIAAPSVRTAVILSKVHRLWKRKFCVCNERG